MIDGALGGRLLLVVRNMLLLLSLIGCGLWAEGAGGARRGRILAGGLLGLVLGLAAAELAVRVPLPGWAPELTVILFGAAVATTFAPPALAASMAALVLLFVQGYAVLGGLGLPLLGWVGVAAGVVFASSAGVGLAVLTRQGLSQRALRVLGVGMIAVGALYLLGALS